MPYSYSLRSNIAPSTANLLEEDEDGELDHRDEVGAFILCAYNKFNEIYLF